MAPTIYSGYEDTGYRPAEGVDAFGPLGEVYAVTFHHSAGPRATSKEKAIGLHKTFQRDHIARGFGDIGYHFSMDDFGRFYKLRPVRYKGAHVGGHNTGNVGIMLHGNYDANSLTDEQNTSLRWLFTGGFVQLIGEREQDIDLVRGHKEWPSHYSNACPGANLMRRINYLRNTQFH